MFNIKVFSMLLYILVSFTFQACAQNKWNLVWSDEFNTPGLPDPSRWSYDVGGDGWGNNELQYYTRERLTNARIEDTTLIIEANKENFFSNQFTSARLVSKGKGDWLYGRIEVRAKIPAGKGTWPAIWMLPTDNTYGGWPSSGEIDIMEHVGYDPGVIHATIHTDSLNHIKGTQVGNSTTVDDFSTKFHVYAIEWYPDHIDAFVDDTKYFTFNNRNEGFKTWPFDKQFHLLINTAVGGSWGGAQGIDSTKFPARFYIDYVRVYQEKQSGPFTASFTSPHNGNVIVNPVKASYSAGDQITIKAVPDDGYVFKSWTGTFDSYTNPLTFNIYRNTDIKALFSLPGEMVSDGQFDDSLKCWTEWSNTTAQATRVVNDGKFEIHISTPGTNDWDLQLSQAGMNMTGNHVYRIKFNAWAANERTITARVNMTTEPFSAWFSKEIAITTTPSVYSFEFTMPQPGDPCARIEFDFGKSAATTCLDDISLVDITSTVIKGALREASVQKKISTIPRKQLQIQKGSIRDDNLKCNLAGKVIGKCSMSKAVSGGIYISEDMNSTLLQ